MTIFFKIFRFFAVLFLALFAILFNLFESLFSLLVGFGALFGDLFVDRRHSVALHIVKTQLCFTCVEHIVVAVRFALNHYGSAARHAKFRARKILSSAHGAYGFAHNLQNASALCAVSAARAVFCVANGTDGLIIFNYVRSARGAKGLSRFHFVSAYLANKHISPANIFVL